MSFKEKSSAWKGPFDKASVRLATSTRQTDLLLPGTPSPIELEIPISQLPLAGRLFGDEMVAIVQNGITCRSSTAIIGAAGETPVLINKTITLVYPATIGQTVFSLGSPDHYGRGFALTDQNALQVTIGGIRMIEDDGSGTWGQYTVDIGASTVTLLTPFGTDPVVIVGDGDVAIFDVFNMNYQTSTVSTRIHTQPLTPTAINTFPPLLFPPSGDMTVVYVNGRAYSDDSVPPSFAVSGQTIVWLDPDYSVYPTDKVVITYAYNVQTAWTGGTSFNIDTRALTIVTANVFPPLPFAPNGQMTVVYINGVAFFDNTTPPSFSISGNTIVWENLLFSAVPGDSVVVTYTYTVM